MVPPIVSAVVPPVVAPVIPSVVDEEHCYVKNIYKSNGKTYIDVDLVAFYKGSEAVQQAIKDNKAAYCDGVYFLPDLYYIQNNYTTTTTYEVSQNSKFNLLQYQVDKNSNSLNSISSNYEKFESYIKETSNFYMASDLETGHISAPRQLLFLIKFKNNVVYDVSFEFTS